MNNGNEEYDYTWNFFLLGSGLEEEAQVGFHEHVFLEHHLEPWCPKRGPIRNFMELVCIGLSKNPYLSVAQKKEHIEWYRRYFDDKRSILVETGALAEAASSTQQSALAWSPEYRHHRLVESHPITHTHPRYRKLAL